MTDLELSIVIPCLNEAKTIVSVIREAQDGIRKIGVRGEIIVSDNGSTDGSQQLATDAGARVVNAPLRGYGAALHFGFLNARGKWILFGDADMSYDFGTIGQFRDYVVEKDKAHVKDLVLGTRLGGTIDPGAMPFLNRYLGTPVLNLVIRLFFGLATSDCNSGMRLVRRAFYLKLPMRAPGMEWASEFLIKSKIFGVRYAEVPIRLRRDQRGRSPHLRRWRDGWRHLKTIVLLSPNRLVLLPSGATALACLWFMSRGLWELALIATTISASGISLGMLVKLVLHADEVRTFPTVSWFLKKPTAEALLGAGLLLSGVGLGAYFSGVNPPVAMMLSIVGSVSVLTSFAWGILVTHCVRTLSLLQMPAAASRPAEPQQPPAFTKAA